VIWDYNGILVDDVAVCVEAVNVLLHKRGLPDLTMDRHRWLFGHPVAEYYTQLGLDLGREALADVSVEYHACLDAMGDLPEMPGIRKLLDLVRQEGVPQFVLSAGEEGWVRDGLKRLGLLEYFDAVYGLPHGLADSKVARGHQLFADHGIEAGRSLYIGDTDHDMQVALTLGCRAIAVACGHQHEERLTQTGMEVLSSLEELAVQLECSLEVQVPGPAAGPVSCRAAVPAWTEWQTRCRPHPGTER